MSCHGMCDILWNCVTKILINKLIANLDKSDVPPKTMNYKCSGILLSLLLFCRLVSTLLYILLCFWLTLHQKTIDNNPGINSFNYSITVEYHIGALSLPSHFNRYFSQPLPTILTKDTESKKKWFQFIRRAQEVREITIRDTFQTNVILCNWVHLPTTA